MSSARPWTPVELDGEGSPAACSSSLRAYTRHSVPSPCVVLAAPALGHDDARETATAPAAGREPARRASATGRPASWWRVVDPARARSGLIRPATRPVTTWSTSSAWRRRRARAAYRCVMSRATTAPTTSREIRPRAPRVAIEGHAVLLRPKPFPLAGMQTSRRYRPRPRLVGPRAGGVWLRGPAPPGSGSAAGLRVRGASWGRARSLFPPTAPTRRRGTTSLERVPSAYEHVERLGAPRRAASIRHAASRRGTAARRRLWSGARRQDYRRRADARVVAFDGDDGGVVLRLGEALAGTPSTSAADPHRQRETAVARFDSSLC